MAVTTNALTSGSDATDAASYVTASVTATEGRQLLIAVLARHTTGGSNVHPSGISGLGQTWTQEEVSPAGTGTTLLSVWRAPGTSVSNGTVTITFPSTILSCTWVLLELIGADGANPVVQSVAIDGNPLTTISVTMAAFGSADNATFGFFGWNAAESGTVGSGFTSLANPTVTPPAGAVLAEWRNDNDTSVDASWTTSTRVSAIGLEIKAAAAGGGVVERYLLEDGTGFYLLESGSVAYLLESSAAPPSVYSAEVTADSPAAWWPMGEASGDIIDSIGAKNGVVTGSPSRDVAGLIQPADDDGAIDFDGVDDEIDGTALPTLGTTWSIEAWFRADVIQNGDVVFACAPTSGPALDFNASLQIGLVWRDSGSVDRPLDGATVLSNGVTYHVVGTHTGTTTKLYVNGIEDATNGTWDSLSFTTGTFDMGHSLSSFNFDGKIDEVALYTTALSPLRVAAHYNAGIGARLFARSPMVQLLPH